MIVLLVINQILLLHDIRSCILGNTHGHINIPDSTYAQYKKCKYCQSADSFHRLQIFYMDSNLMYPQAHSTQIIY